MVGSEKETRVIHSPRLGEVIHYIVLTDRPAPRGKKRRHFPKYMFHCRNFLFIISYTLIKAYTFLAGHTTLRKESQTQAQAGGPDAGDVPGNKRQAERGARAVPIPEPPRWRLRPPRRRQAWKPQRQMLG